MLLITTVKSANDNLKDEWSPAGSNDMTMLLFYRTNTVLIPFQFIVLPLNNTFQEKSQLVTLLKLPEIKKDTTPYQSFKINYFSNHVGQLQRNKKIKIKLKCHKKKKNHTSQDICRKDNVINSLIGSPSHYNTLGYFKRKQE